jgi:nucleoside diphosphate kinase
MSRRAVVENLMAIKDNCDNLVFAFFHPWTIYCGKAKPMLESIIRQGFRVAEFSFHRLTERDIEFVYAGNRPISKLTSWYIPRQLFEMGMSCGVIFYRKEPGQTATGMMTRLKGKSQPFLNSPGQLRYDFRAANKSINLIHSSDDCESTIAEALIFFTPEEVEWALRCGHLARFAECEARLLRHPAYTGLESICDEAATTLLIKLRIRALNLLGRTLDPAVCKPLFELWNRLLDRDYLALSVHEEAKQYPSLIADEQRLLQPVLHSLHGPSGVDRPRRSLKRTPVAAITGFLETLAEPDRYGEADSEALLSVPVFFDCWEEQLFKTTLLHFDELRNGHV